MKGYIYKYTFPSGKVYIGQTRRIPEMRHREHFYQSIGKANPKFWEEYQKSGNPLLEIIETIEEKRVQDLVPRLNAAETEYIHIYDATNPEKGCNIRDNAYVAIPRDKVLEAERDRIWNDISKEWFSILNSIEDKCVKTFEPLTEEELEFCQTELTDEENIFAGALKEFNFDFNNLKSNSEDSRFWLGECIDFAKVRFEDTYKCGICYFISQNKEQILEEHSPETTIVQIDKNGKIVREYISINEVLEAMGVAYTTNIYNALEGKQKHAYGYIWRYKKDLDRKENQDSNGQLSLDFE